jgi:PAS domain-containing protein
VEGIAEQAAIALAAAQPGPNGSNHSPHGASELEAILASMSDALLVLDDQGCLVRLNQAARKMLCPADCTLILGHPVDQPQHGRWPLGTQALTEQLVPIVEELKRGNAPAEEVAVSLSDDGRATPPVACKASVLIKEGRPAGGVMILRETGRARAAA